jgi:hypothetical protein
VLPLAEARRLCARIGARADACSWIKGSTCYLVIPRDGPVRDLGAYSRRELAHCNGWSHGRRRMPKGAGAEAREMKCALSNKTLRLISHGLKR